MMNPRLASALALILPLAGLGTVWVQTDRLSRQGTEWDVPVQGYDPRDVLRGHYVEFRYDWPQLAHDDLYGSDLCLAGQAPRIDRVRRLESLRPGGGEATCANFARGMSSGLGEFGGTVGGRLYAPKDAALAMQGKLRDPRLQGVIRIRLRPDGQITPLRITFRPRPPAAAPDHASVPIAPVAPVPPPPR